MKAIGNCSATLLSNAANGDEHMKPDYFDNRLGMHTQVVPKRESQNKRVEIITIRLTDSQPACTNNMRPVCGGDIAGLGIDHPRMVTDECGPDLFFEIWDFSDVH